MKKAAPKTRKIKFLFLLVGFVKKNKRVCVNIVDKIDDPARIQNP